VSALLACLVVLVAVFVVPLGVRLLRVAQLPTEAWVGAGLFTAVGLAQPPGAAAVAWVLPWCLACAHTATLGLGRLLREDEPRLRALSAGSAALSLAVCAGALVIDRTGTSALSFGPTTWRLTVLHFAVAGFAGALLTGLAVVAAGNRVARVGAVAVPAGVALVGTGHFLGPWVELAGAVVLTTGLLAASWTLLRHVVHLEDDAGQLLALAAVSTPFTMALALWWALAEVAHLPHLSLTETAATHGVTNALGVGLCGVLGWTALTKEQL
jgi:hypothetical protein